MVTRARETWAIIVNPAARGAVVRIAEVRGLLAEAGIRAVEHRTTADAAGGEQTAEALAAGASRIIAIGGDGTVTAVAGALRGTGVPLSVVPAGTGNLIARGIASGARARTSGGTGRHRDGPGGIARLGGAFRRSALGRGAVRPEAVLGERIRHRDVGLASIRTASGVREERLFLAAAGIGNDARSIAETSAAAKRRFGAPAYIGAGARFLFAPGPDVELTIERGRCLGDIGVGAGLGDTGAGTGAAGAGSGSAGAESIVWTGRAWSVLVGFVPTVMPGVTVFPRARDAAGEFDVLICGAASALDWTGIAAFGLGLRRTVPESLGYRPASWARITPETPTPMQLDGELVPAVADVELGVDRAALALVVG